ncbi:MAG TPA: hypothetical protein DEG71_05755 [Clostridiales bacterium]|nr:hypothetical protein [Clostridiales bacterium]
MTYVFLFIFIIGYFYELNKRIDLEQKIYYKDKMIEHHKFISNLWYERYSSVMEKIYANR